MGHAARLFGLDDDPPEPTILDLVKKMHSVASEEQVRSIKNGDSLHTIGYTKGKVAALWEVIQMLETGEIPE
jgi:hypothetical protein